MRKVTDWRASIRKHPATAVAVTLGAGVVVGMLSRSERPTRMVPAAGRAQRGAQSAFLSDVAREIWHEGRNVALLMLTRSITSLLTNRTRK